MIKITHTTGKTQSSDLLFDISFIEGGDIGENRHGLCRWYYINNPQKLAHEHNYRFGRLHGYAMDEGIISYWIDGTKVSKEEFRRYELIEELAGLGEE